MQTPHFHIIPFQNEHQPDIDAFMDSIAKEYAENIFSSQFKRLKEIAGLPGHRYWVAEVNGKVVGTSGFWILSNHNMELKRMFLHKDFRGQGIAQALMDTVINAAIEHKISTVYLGTMEQFKTAQAFYEKNSFTQIPREALPHDFAVNPIDKVFYKRELK